MTENHIDLSGTISEYETINIDGSFRFKSFITIKRKSNLYDTIPVMFPASFHSVLPSPRSDVSVHGEYRTINSDRHLLTYALIDSISESVPGMNDVYLTGYLCKNPSLRQSPKGLFISDLCLAAGSYIPCVAWGQDAIDISQLGIGVVLSLYGHMQSRNYKKDGQVLTAYELSIKRYTVK